MTQEIDSAPDDPFDHEQVARAIETGVVRMNELACLPERTIAANGELAVAENLLGPVGIVAQVCENLVVLVEKRHPSMQVRNQQHIAANIEVSRKADW